VETAKYLLAQISFERIPDFLDYALAEAKKTRFDVQTLGGLKQYLSSYQERRKQQAAAEVTKVQREAEDKATKLRMDYDRFRRAAADRLFSSLPAKEQAAIEAAARAKAPALGGKWVTRSDHVRGRTRPHRGSATSWNIPHSNNGSTGNSENQM